MDGIQLVQGADYVDLERTLLLLAVCRMHLARRSQLHISSELEASGARNESVTHSSSMGTSCELHDITRVLQEICFCEELELSCAGGHSVLQRIEILCYAFN